MRRVHPIKVVHYFNDEISLAEWLNRNREKGREEEEKKRMRLRNSNSRVLPIV